MRALCDPPKRGPFSCEHGGVVSVAAQAEVYAHSFRRRSPQSKISFRFKSSRVHCGAQSEQTLANHAHIGDPVLLFALHAVAGDVLLKLPRQVLFEFSSGHGAKFKATGASKANRNNSLRRGSVVGPFFSNLATPCQVSRLRRGALFCRVTENDRVLFVQIRRFSAGFLRRMRADATQGHQDNRSRVRGQPPSHPLQMGGRHLAWSNPVYRRTAAGAAGCAVSHGRAGNTGEGVKGWNIVKQHVYIQPILNGSERNPISRRRIEYERRV